MRLSLVAAVLGLFASSISIAAPQCHSWPRPPMKLYSCSAMCTFFRNSHKMFYGEGVTRACAYSDLINKASKNALCSDEDVRAPGNVTCVLLVDGITQ